jgi:hypothetical protein
MGHVFVRVQLLHANRARRLAPADHLAPTDNVVLPPTVIAHPPRVYVFNRDNVPLQELVALLLPGQANNHFPNHSSSWPTASFLFYNKRAPWLPNAGHHAGTSRERRYALHFATSDVYMPDELISAWLLARDPALLEPGPTISSTRHFSTRDAAFAPVKSPPPRQVLTVTDSTRRF